MSDAIADNVREYFPEVQIISRPEEIQGDFVSMNEIIVYDLSQLEGEHFLQTHSTNPLLTSATLDRAIETYFSNLDEYDSLFSVTRLQSRLRLLQLRCRIKAYYCSTFDGSSDRRIGLHFTANRP